MVVVSLLLSYYVLPIAATSRKPIFFESSRFLEFDNCDDHLNYRYCYLTKISLTYSYYGLQQIT